VASISKEPNGRKRILFVNGDGGRKAIRLGKMSLPDAREVKSKVEAILSANLSRRAFDNPTAAWVADIPDSLATKLAQVGLIPKRDRRKASTLECFVESYIVRRTDDVSPNTQRIWRQTKRNFAAFFAATNRWPRSPEAMRLTGGCRWCRAIWRMQRFANIAALPSTSSLKRSTMSLSKSIRSPVWRLHLLAMSCVNTSSVATQRLKCLMRPLTRNGD